MLWNRPIAQKKEDKLYRKDIIPYWFITGFPKILNHLLLVFPYSSISQALSCLGSLLNLTLAGFLSTFFTTVLQVLNKYCFFLKADFLYPIIYSWSISCYR